MNNLITNIINQEKFYSFPPSACQEMYEALNWFVGHVRDKRMSKVAYSVPNRYDSLVANMSDTGDTEVCRIRKYLIGFTMLCEGILAYYGSVFRESEARYAELLVLESARWNLNPYHDSEFFSKVDDLALMRAIVDYNDRNVGAIMYLIAHSGACADVLESCITQLQQSQSHRDLANTAEKIAQFAIDSPLFWDFVESYPRSFAPMLDTLEGLSLKLGIGSVRTTLENLTSKWADSVGSAEQEV